MPRFSVTSHARWLGVLLSVTLVSTGCQQLRRRDATAVPTSPTPYEVAPDFGSPSQPTPLAAPALPPAEDLVIPPPPGTASHGEFGGPRLGGFTAPKFHDLPDLTIPAADLDDPSAPRIQPTSNDELDVVADNDLKFPVDEPVLLREFLKSKPQQAVELDADLFRLELEAERLEAPVIAVPMPQEIVSGDAMQPIVVQSLPPKSSGRSVAEWPTGGVPQDIIIAPGPSVQKWAAETTAPVRSTPPRRLADDNSDWAVRTIE